MAQGSVQQSACAHPVLARDLFPADGGLVLRRICLTCRAAWLDGTVNGETRSMGPLIGAPGHPLNQLPAGLNPGGCVGAH